MARSERRWRLMLALAALLGAAACAPIKDTRGYMPEPEQVAQVVPGITTKDKVYDLFGSPSSMGTFDQKVWYYIEKKTQKRALGSEETTDQQVLAVEFDQSGTVTEVKRWGMKDGVAVTPVARVTETRGRELSFLQQIFGNLGRFNSKVPGGFGSPTPRTSTQGY
jgi:outer membrane protein assembly factor BamE (lipoprotein component of BamABCDE complex)